MDPVTAIDRAIRDAMHVYPAADFGARVRARVAAAPPEPGLFAPRFAVAAVACALLAVIAVSVWRESETVAARPVLPHRDLIVLSHPPRPLAFPPQLTERGVRPFGHTADVVVSRSEMLALQRLFAGITLAPAPLPAPPDELSIPKLEIEPLPPLVAGPEGERQ